MHAPAIATATTPTEQSRPLIGADAIARALIAGFVASLTMLLLFLVAYNLARLLSAAPFPTWPAIERDSIIHPGYVVGGGGQAATAAGGAAAWPGGFETLRLWLLNLTHNPLIDAGLNEVYLAAGVYVAGGLLWAVVYSMIEPHLSGSPLVRGVTFAMIPALASLVVVLPLFGGGLFGLAFGAGPLPLIGNVLLHAAYGAVLGVVCGPLGDLDASTLERPTDPGADTRPRAYERVTAILLIGGLVVGGAAGLAISMAAGGEAAQAVGSSSNGWLVLSGALLGAAFGLFIGSFLGLVDRPPRAADR
jgi:hypothetical protein